MFFNSIGALPANSLCCLVQIVRNLHELRCLAVDRSLSFNLSIKDILSSLFRLHGEF